MVYLNEGAQVRSDRRGLALNGRLDRAVLDMVEPARTDHEAVVRYETVRSAMDTALATILGGFACTARRPDVFGLGHIVEQPPNASLDCSGSFRARD
ncbi:hypothetical protein [Streptomyces cyaneofuscatus]|uniref:hypothetical protein n=1 Tax=Streptomyces cyaneofuscatus TaxID=66883 RepID=UPI00364A635F